MAVSIQMPRQGNTVEECLLVEWRVKEGDTIREGDIVCAIETDKASFEVASTADGTVLRFLANEGDLVPVLSDIVVIGESGETVSDTAPSPSAETTAPEPALKETPAVSFPAPQESPATPSGFRAVSPRARHLAEGLGVDPRTIQGTGPNGRVVSLDVHKAIADGSAFKATPLAKEVMASTGKRPMRATGIGGSALAGDLDKPAASGAAHVTPSPDNGQTSTVPYKGIRKLIGDRMRHSLRDTAQLTLNASADASGLLHLRSIFKDNAEETGLPKITINDLVCWVVVQTLPSFPDLNALFDGEGAVITRYRSVNLAFAVDTPRGLMVPVVANAERLSLAELSQAIASLAADCRGGSVNPDFLSGGTFTISNLGGMGIESFTPVLNPPQVGILGVCAITQQPIPKVNNGMAFRPTLGLSLTFDHQAVDGAPAARFLQAVTQGIASVQTSLALRGARSL